MPVAITESAPFAQAATPADGPGRFRIRIISAGVGSSGVYPVESLKAAAEARTFKAGTHMYLDHPTASEAWERPERSVRDLIAVLATDAEYVEEDGGALDADIEVFSAWRATVQEMAKNIGVSMRGTAEVNEHDEQGRPIIARIIEAKSVDFVTRAGRGGKVLALIESARAADRATARGVSEATAGDMRDRLNDLVKDAHATKDDDGDRTWTWVRDFDPDAHSVWFELEGVVNGIFQQEYLPDADGAPTALTGERVEVAVRTEYVPVTPTDVPSRPAGQTTATESEEDHMATTQIEESELATLRTDAGRATALESELAEAKRVRDEQKKFLAEAHAAADTAAAARIIAEADVDFDELQTAGLLASAPRITESGRLDTDAFTKAVAEHAAKIAEAQGAGSVRGVGGGTTPSGGAPTVAQLDESVGKAFGRTVKEA